MSCHTNADLTTACTGREVSRTLTENLSLMTFRRSDQVTRVAFAETRDLTFSGLLERI